MDATDFDRIVGRIAGAIYGDIAVKFPQPPLLLVPALTFKVRKILEQVTDLSLLDLGQKEELARDIQVSLVPMLYSYEIEPDVIEKIGPTIQSAAYRALVHENQNKKGGSHEGH